jgi:hypothetical protein
VWGLKTKEWTWFVRKRDTAISAGGEEVATDGGEPAGDE